MDIKALIQQTENERLEFKRDLSSTTNFVKDVCAFANASGGILIIGVEDTTKELIGIKEEEIIDLEEKIANILSGSIEPMVNYIARTYNVDGKMLMYLDIFPGQLPPYFVRSKGIPEGVYARVGSTSRPASVEFISELERRRLNISFDSTEVYGSSKNDLDFGLIEYYLERRKQVNNIPKVDISDRFLESIRVLKRVGSSLMPTVGGILLFSPRNFNLLPNAVLKCARFRGNSSQEYIDKKEFKGPLIKQIESAMNFFKMNEKKSAVIDGTYREEQYAIPEIAIREVIINAVIHRDYNVTGSDIKFNIYDDCIEIISPGRLPFGITIEDIGLGISKTRNTVIAKIFSDMGVVEEWGKGISKIKESIAQVNLRAPEFIELSNFFKVILYKTKLEKKEVLTLTKNEYNIFNEYTHEQVKKLLEYIKTNNFITNSKCRELFNVNIDQAKYILNKLVENNLLDAIGERKSRKYILKK